jgi:hypothetical protein
MTRALAHFPPRILGKTSVDYNDYPGLSFELYYDVLECFAHCGNSNHRK